MVHFCKRRALESFDSSSAKAAARKIEAELVPSTKSEKGESRKKGAQKHRLLAVQKIPAHVTSFMLNALLSFQAGRSQMLNYSWRQCEPTEKASAALCYRICTSSENGPNVLWH